MNLFMFVSASVVTSACQYLTGGAVVGLAVGEEDVGLGAGDVVLM